MEEKHKQALVWVSGREGEVWLCNLRMRTRMDLRYFAASPLPPNINWCSLCGKQYGNSLKKKNTEKLSSDLATPVLDISPKDLKARTRTGICIPLFTSIIHSSQMSREG